MVIHFWYGLFFFAVRDFTFPWFIHHFVHMIRSISECVPHTHIYIFFAWVFLKPHDDYLSYWCAWVCINFHYVYWESEQRKKKKNQHERTQAMPLRLFECMAGAFFLSLDFHRTRLEHTFFLCFVSCDRWWVVSICFTFIYLFIYLFTLFPHRFVFVFFNFPPICLFIFEQIGKHLRMHIE